MYPSEYGIIFNDGKSFMSWDDYLNMVADPRLREKVKKDIQNRVSYAQMRLYQDMDLTSLSDLAQQLGMKITEKTTVKQIKNRINQKIDKYRPKEETNVLRIREQQTANTKAGSVKSD